MSHQRHHVDRDDGMAPTTLASTGTITRKPLPKTGARSLPARPRPDPKCGSRASAHQFDSDAMPYLSVLTRNLLRKPFHIFWIALRLYGTGVLSVGLIWQVRIGGSIPELAAVPIFATNIRRNSFLLCL